MTPETIDISDRGKKMLKEVKVNGPAMMLRDGLLDLFISLDIRPEIGLSAAALDGFGPADFQKMAARLEEAGLRPSIHGPFLDLCPGSLDKQVLELSRARFVHALETAAVFSPEHMVFHCGYEPYKYHSIRREWMDISIETWVMLAEKAEKLKIPLVLENTFEASPDDLAPVLDALSPHGVGFCLDVGHAHAFSRTRLDIWLDVMKDHLAALHLHDNHGIHDEHLAIGQGDIDFQYLFSFLVDKNTRPRVITLEPHEKGQLGPSLSALADLWPWRILS